MPTSQTSRCQSIHLRASAFSLTAGRPFGVSLRRRAWAAADVPALALRPASAADNWALTALYTHVTPDGIQQAEGWHAGCDDPLPWLRSWVASQGATYVLLDQGSVCGMLQLTAGPHGSWLQWRTDTLRPDGAYVRALLGHGLRLVADLHGPLPVYCALAEHEGGVGSLLTEFGFAPFSDRVRLVKPVVKWVRETVATPVPVMEPASEVVPTAFAAPENAASQPRT